MLNLLQQFTTPILNLINLDLQMLCISVYFLHFSAHVHHNVFPEALLISSQERFRFYDHIA